MIHPSKLLLTPSAPLVPLKQGGGQLEGFSIKKHFKLLPCLRGGPCKGEG